MTQDRLNSRRPAEPADDTGTIESAVREHLGIMFRSPHFDASERSRNFLRFVIEETLSGRGDALDQTSIAMSVFARDCHFDAVMDPIVRVQAGRLRRSLERYYLLSADPRTLRIELPKGSYSPRFASDCIEAPARVSQAVHDPADWPAVLIAGFGAQTAADVEAAVRLKEELTLELTRYGTVRVVGQADLEQRWAREQSKPRFELRGSLRGAGEEFVIKTALVDRYSGTQLWGDEYRASEAPGQSPGKLDDIARVIAARLGDEHGVVLTHLVSANSGRHIGGLGTFNAVLRGQHFFCSRQIAELAPAIASLQQVTASQPEHPLAWIQLARLCLADYAFELSGSAIPIDRIIDYACEGVRLDPANPRASCVLAGALLVKGESQAAHDEIENALRHNRQSLAYRDSLGWLLALAGSWDRGMNVVRDAAARSPYSLPYAKHALWADHLLHGQIDKAYVAALEFRDASGFWPPMMQATCLGHLGRVDEARIPLTTLLAAKPGFVTSGRRLVGYFIKHPDFLELVADGLARAGLRLA